MFEVDVKQTTVHFQRTKRYQPVELNTVHWGLDDNKRPTLAKIRMERGNTKCFPNKTCLVLIKLKFYIKDRVLP